MGANWHHAFDPRAFLARVNVEQLLTKNDAYADNRVNKLGEPCIYCRGRTAPGLLLNDGKYLCKSCFERISLIQYPEKYERLRREYLAACEAHNRARQSLVENSFERKSKKFFYVVFALSFLLWFAHIGFVAVTALAILMAIYLGNRHNTKVKEWEDRYPPPPKPTLRHFHDPAAELSQADKITVHIFDHWPGYPPFWDYLRAVVLNRDGGRCQVTGCPSRLELHIHHERPISEGGSHCPENLVPLCDFHHALEPHRGHERIWGAIKTRFFTLVCEHTRSNRTTEGFHQVRAHLRRLQLVTLQELRDLMEIYGFCCPECGEDGLIIEVFNDKNLIKVDCPSCGESIQTPQELTEETGPRLAEQLVVTQNEGRWESRWDVLAERKSVARGKRERSGIASRRKKE